MKPRGDINISGDVVVQWRESIRDGVAVARFNYDCTVLAEVREKARSLGCMGVNAICEMAREDADVRALTETSAALLEATLTDAIEDGKAKGGASTEVLRDVAAFAVHSLGPR